MLCCVYMMGWIDVALLFHTVAQIEASDDEAFINNYGNTGPFH